MARANKNDVEHLYDRAASWTDEASDLDRSADFLERNHFSDLAASLRKVADDLRACAKSARVMAREVE